jgi:hypothetical protein
MSKSKKSTGAEKSNRRADNHQAKKPRFPEPRYLDWRTLDPSTLEYSKNFKLKEELFTYKDRLEELLRDEGKYVLIKGREVIGIYADEEEAIRDAAVRFGGEPVLIKQISAKERLFTMGGIVC